MSINNRPDCPCCSAPQNFPAAGGKSYTQPTTVTTEAARERVKAGQVDRAHSPLAWTSRSAGKEWPWHKFKPEERPRLIYVRVRAPGGDGPEFERLPVSWVVNLMETDGEPFGPRDKAAAGNPDIYKSGIT